MVFDFFKRKEGVPDVGQEESYEAEKKKSFKNKIFAKKGKTESVKEIEKEEKDIEKELKKLDGIDRELKKGNFRKGAIQPGIVQNASTEYNKLEFDKINAKIEALSALLRGYNERFSLINQQIGELRAMNLSNEKNITNAIQAGAKASDIVKEVKPERLRMDYQRMDTKIVTLSEKIEANKQFMQTIMNEVKDLRRKAGIFIGTDALLKLNEEVKKDLVELQKMSSRVRLNADKSEQLFIELKKGFSEYQKTNEVIANLDSSYSGLREEIEKLKLDYSNIVKNSDLNDFKKMVNNKFVALESSIVDIENIKNNNERLSNLVENMLLICKKNEEDIANLAVTIGDDKVKKISNYENHLISILKILDTLSTQVSEIRKKLKMKTPKKIFGGIKKEIKKEVEKNKKELESEKNTKINPEPSDSVFKKSWKFFKKPLEKIKINKTKKKKKRKSRPKEKNLKNYKLKQKNSKKFNKKLRRIKNKKLRK